MRRPPSPAATVGIRLMVPTLGIVALFLLAVGHDEPGGGFVAGLLVGVGLVTVAVGKDPVIAGTMLPVRGEVILGSGLLASLLAGLIGMVFGVGFLDTVSFKVALPLLGELKLATVLLFDIGVMAVVVGLVAVIVDRFDAEDHT